MKNYIIKKENDFSFAYESDLSIMDKLNAIATKVYHANGVELTDEAIIKLEQLEKLGFNDLPICMAKTQYSFSDDPTKLGAPEDFNITIRNLKVSSGAGFRDAGNNGGIDR